MTMEAVKLTLEIPDEVLDAVRLPPREIEGEFRKELALALYQRGALSLGKARVLAQMTCWEFEELLGQRKVVRHYTHLDLEEDIQYALGGE
jgi:predicted HTH domain antitoxin